jgi:hypothetical protein
MSWLERHPYAAMSALAGIVLIIGALIVESRTSAKPGTLSVWGGTGAPLLNPTSYSPNAVVSAMPQTHGNPGISPIYIPPTQTQTADEPGATEEFDFEAFVSALTQPAGPKGSAATDSGDMSAIYSLIPSGLIATTTEPVRTEAQQKLFNYGNDAASYIQTYEDSNRNASVALRDQAEDRQNPQKKQAVKLVAAGLRTAGESLLGMEELPPLVAGTHKALAESYIEVSRELAKVPDANGDEAFIAAINTYNAAADTLVKNYVSLATAFSLAGVKFSPQDPGSIFTFSAGGGL